MVVYDGSLRNNHCVLFIINRFIMENNKSKLFKKPKTKKSIFIIICLILMMIIETKLNLYSYLVAIVRFQNYSCTRRKISYNDLEYRYNAIKSVVICIFIYLYIYHKSILFIFLLLLWSISGLQCMHCLPHAMLQIISF